MGINVETMQQKLQEKGIRFGFDAASCALSGYEIGLTDAVTQLLQDHRVKRYPDRFIVDFDELRRTLCERYGCEPY